MKVSVILAHPGKTSFNHAIAETIVQALQQSGHTVRYHDVYEEEFDPILPHAEIPKEAQLAPAIERHCDEVVEADGIVIVHPNWWGQPPAILKGWIDRVIRPGVAYEFAEGDSGEGVPIGLLGAKVALVFNTSNTSAKRESEVFGDPLEALWKNCIFDLCGVKTFYRRMYRVIATSTLEQRRAWLREVRETVMTYFPAELEPEDATSLTQAEADRIAQFLDLSTAEPRQADLAFVFGTLHSDPAHIAVDLLQRQVVERVVLTGGSNRVDGSEEARTHLAILVNEGVPRDRIIVEDESTNTLENVRFALRKIADRLDIESLRTIVVVTKWYHCRRAVMTLKRHLPPGIRYFAKTYEPNGLARVDWHLNAEAARRALKEWQCIPEYLRRGHISTVERNGGAFI